MFCAGRVSISRYQMVVRLKKTKYYEDANAEMAYKTIALSATCSVYVAQLLLDNNADVNRTNKSNQNALYCLPQW